MKFCLNKYNYMYFYYFVLFFVSWGIVSNKITVNNGIL